jgi:hypothetical protein
MFCLQTWKISFRKFLKNFCPVMYSSLCKKFKNKSILAILFQSSKWKFAITGLNQILEFIFYIHLLVYTVVLINNLKKYWSEQSFTGLGWEDRCSSWGLPVMPFGFITPKHVLNYLTFQSLDFERIRWRLFRAYQMKVVLSVSDEGYSERIRWRLFRVYQMKVVLSVSDEGYSERIRWRLFRAYQMQVILSVSDEGYSERIRWRLFWAYQMKVISETCYGHLIRYLRLYYRVSKINLLDI